MADYAPILMAIAKAAPELAMKAAQAWNSRVNFAADTVQKGVIAEALEVLANRRVFDESIRDGYLDPVLDSLDESRLILLSKAAALHSYSRGNVLILAMVTIIRRFLDKWKCWHHQSVNVTYPQTGLQKHDVAGLVNEHGVEIALLFRTASIDLDVLRADLAPLREELAKIVAGK